MKENELLKVKTDIEEEKKMKKNKTKKKNHTETFSSFYSKQRKFRDSALGATVSQTTSGK